MEMKQKLLIALLMGFVVACNFLFPPVTSTPDLVRPSSPDVTRQPEKQILSGFTIVRLHPQDGDLSAMLATEAQTAGALDQMPVVEFDATWCPPCQAIDAAIQSGDQLMFAAYKGTYIIKLDVDEWGWKNGKVQDFRFDGIPVYFKLDSQGKQTGEVIDGGAWGEDIPENIAPVMDKFFHGE
jgi:thiol-disulfide isomerase/thioredoxin